MGGRAQAAAGGAGCGLAPPSKPGRAGRDGGRGRCRRALWMAQEDALHREARRRLGLPRRSADANAALQTARSPQGLGRPARTVGGILRGPTQWSRAGRRGWSQRRNLARIRAGGSLPPPMPGPSFTDSNSIEWLSSSSRSPACLCPSLGLGASRGWGRCRSLVCKALESAACRWVTGC